MDVVEGDGIAVGVSVCVGTVVTVGGGVTRSSHHSNGNAANATINGAEFELTAKPPPDLLLTANYALLDAAGAAAGKLLCLDATQIAHAIAISATQAARLPARSIMA